MRRWKWSLEVMNPTYELQSWGIPSVLFFCFLFFQPQIILFWFTLSALIVLFSATAACCFFTKKPWEPTARHLPGNKTADGQNQRPAGEQSGAFRSQRASCFPQETEDTTNKTKKESEYYTYIHLVDTNTTQDNKHDTNVTHICWI